MQKWTEDKTKHTILYIIVTWMHSCPLIFFMVYIPECKQQLAVPMEPNIIRMVLYGTCMVFMMLQAVIYVIVLI